jgi:hypothetical protein
LRYVLDYKGAGFGALLSIPLTSAVIRSLYSNGQGGDIDPFGMTPETLEVVVRTSRFGKDMDDEVTVIQQDPFGGVIALETDRKLAHLLQLLGNLIRYRLRLARVRYGTNNEEIREGSYFPKV